MSNLSISTASSPSLDDPKCQAARRSARNSCNSFIGRKLRQGALAALDKMFGAGQNTDLELMMRASVMESPLRSLIMFSRGTLSKKQLTGLLAAINLDALELP
jgi:hypothetical protein